MAIALSLSKFIDVFGEDIIIDVLSSIPEKHPNNILGITNPILRFISETNEFNGRKLKTKQNIVVPPEDLSIYKITSSVLGNVKSEIKANPSYQKQLLRNLLSPRMGSMLTAFNEILAGAYFKSLGHEIKFNSSLDKNKPDVDLINLPFAIDAKLYPNQILQMETVINESAQEIIEALKDVHRQDMVIMVKIPEKKAFTNSLKKLGKAFEDKSVNKYNDEGIFAYIAGSNYAGAHVKINLQTTGTVAHFQPNWDMAKSIEDMKNSCIKATQQTKSIGKKAIPWVMVPRDGLKMGIQVQMIRFVAKFHQFVTDYKEEIYIMPVFALDFEGKKVNWIFDIHQIGSNVIGVKQDSFDSFVNSCINSPDFYV